MLRVRCRDSDEGVCTFRCWCWVGCDEGVLSIRFLSLFVMGGGVGIALAAFWATIGLIGCMRLYVMIDVMRKNRTDRIGS
jgi:hypothetical protein